LPCVITTEDEKHELIMSQSNGVIVKSDDQKALTTALEKMVTEVNLRSVLGANARASVDKEFRLDRMIDAYRNVFKSLGNS
jgi:glycosyltransferase involved in cell wall biosynthesis